MNQTYTSETFATAVEKRKYTLRRSQLEIQMDILRVVGDGANLPTQIMYKANLAWVALQGCLNSLVGSGLLERVLAGGRRSYQLTSKGIGALASYRQVLESVRQVAQGTDRRF
jgi:predicted transcriptional regulator